MSARDDESLGRGLRIGRGAMAATKVDKRQQRGRGMKTVVPRRDSPSKPIGLAVQILMTGETDNRLRTGKDFNAPSSQ